MRAQSAADSFLAFGFSALDVYVTYTLSLYENQVYSGARPGSADNGGRSVPADMQRLASVGRHSLSGTREAAPEPDWESAHVRAQMARLREAGVQALANAPSQKERKLLRRFYSEAGLRERVRLLSHPQVVRALDIIWQAADSDGSQYIERSEYLVMHRKLVLALNPATTPQGAAAAAREDWIKDSQGKAALDKERFSWCWFELADLWVPTFNPSHYVRFLTSTIGAITSVGDDGVAEWAPDRDVLNTYCKRRDAGSKYIEHIDARRPEILALWHQEIKKDALAHMALSFARARRATDSNEATTPTRTGQGSNSTVIRLSTNALVAMMRQDQDRERAVLFPNRCRHGLDERIRSPVRQRRVPSAIQPTPASHQNVAASPSMLRPARKPEELHCFSSSPRRWESIACEERSKERANRVAHGMKQNASKGGVVYSCLRPSSSAPGGTLRARHPLAAPPAQIQCSGCVIPPSGRRMNAPARRPDETIDLALHYDFSLLSSCLADGFPDAPSRAPSRADGATGECISPVPDAGQFYSASSASLGAATSCREPVATPSAVMARSPYHAANSRPARQVQDALGPLAVVTRRSSEVTPASALPASESLCRCHSSYKLSKLMEAAAKAADAHGKPLDPAASVGELVSAAATVTSRRPCSALRACYEQHSTSPKRPSSACVPPTWSAAKSEPP